MPENFTAIIVKTLNAICANSLISLTNITFSFQWMDYDLNNPIAAIRSAHIYYFLA